MTAGTQPSSLEDLINSLPNLADHFYNDTVPPSSRVTPGMTPVPLQFSNWREEQRAWREAAVFFDQSHHMPELFLKGPGAFRLLNYLGINSFKNFVPGRAKQFVACNYNGQVIGECVIYYLEENSFELVSGMHLQDWVQFNAETGDYNVTVERDLDTASDPKKGRVRYRFGLDGPHAEAIFREVVEGMAPEIPFFRTAKVRIAGCDVLALRHGMAGHKGVELSGPYAEGPAIRAAILEAGKNHGLRQGGRLAYFSAQGEGGWMAYPLSAVYTDAKLRDFRKWLPATSWAGRAQLAGSDRSSDIEHYYLTPWDMGLDRIMKFDHDFIGRAALESMVDKPHRTKVTLVWNKEDIARIQASQFEPEPRLRYIEFPIASYGFPQCDAVRTSVGKLVGRAGFSGYSANEGKMLSIASVDSDLATPGTELLLTWGEPDGGSRKAQVERHRQIDVRVTVAAVPYADAARAARGEGIGGSVMPARIQAHVVSAG